MGSRTIALVGRMRAATYQQVLGPDTKLVSSPGVAQAVRDPQVTAADVIVVEIESLRLIGVQTLRSACPSATIVALATVGAPPPDAEVRAAGYDRAIAARTPEELGAALRGVGRKG